MFPIYSCVNMGLIMLTTLIYLANLSAATCPRFRPLTASDSCRTNLDCPKGKSCCQYPDSKYCVSTNPNTCISEGKVVKKGESITLKDKCTTCDCYGYDDLICTNDGCVQLNTASRVGSCPLVQPSSANKRCTYSNECSNGYTCCRYFFGSFCTLADPTICYSKGRKVPVGKMVTLDDGCSECECQGHDSFLCINDGCFWPKPPKQMDCYYGGKSRKHGSGFLSTDGCNNCSCTFGRVLCTLKACIKYPFHVPNWKELL